MLSQKTGTVADEVIIEVGRKDYISTYGVLVGPRAPDVPM